ncbi:MAG: hypothetical protein WC994_07900 [Brumimicrobium sp.]
MNNQTLMLEQSTYYILDAQGNQLNIYEHSVDSVSGSVYYYLTDRNIYGSSRIGVTKDTLNMFNPSVLQSYGILGNRNYELTDHRGNVQTVINDIKYPLSSDNTTIDSYEVGINSIADYSPFGVQLDGRTIENVFYYPENGNSPQTPADTVEIYNNNFDNPPATGSPYYSTEVTLDANLSNTKWTSSIGTFTNYNSTGAGSGKSIAISSASADTAYLTLSFDVENGYELDITSYSFAHRSSATGYTNYKLVVNGIEIGNGSIYVSSSGSSLQSTGIVNAINSVSGQMGSVNVVLKLFGGSHGSGGTFRMDDFVLNGFVEEVNGSIVSDIVYALEDDFETASDWDEMTIKTQITYPSGKMRVRNTGIDYLKTGASHTFTVGTGVHEVNFEVKSLPKALCDPVQGPIDPFSQGGMETQSVIGARAYLICAIKDINGTIVAIDSSKTVGTFPTMHFTPNYSGNYTMELFISGACNNAYFEVDDVFITYEEDVVVENTNAFIATNYRYGFQGQEKDDEVKGAGNSVNYKYRMHDPRLGRFFAVDPLAKDYPFYSPYSFSGNRVLDAVELEGLEPASVHLILVNDAGEVEYDNIIEASGTAHLGSYHLENLLPNLGLKSKDFALNSHVTIKFNVDAQKVEGLAESASAYVFGERKTANLELSNWERNGPLGIIIGEENADKFRNWESDNLSGKAPLPIRVLVKILPGPAWVDALHTMITGEDMMSPERGEVTGWKDRYALPVVTLGTGVYGMFGGTNSVIKGVGVGSDVHSVGNEIIETISENDKLDQD